VNSSHFDVAEVSVGYRGPVSEPSTPCGGVWAPRRHRCCKRDHSVWNPARTAHVAISRKL